MNPSLKLQPNDAALHGYANLAARGLCSPRFWQGCLLHKTRGVRPLGVANLFKDFGSNLELMQHAIPSVSQTVNDCTCEGLGGIVEINVRRHQGPDAIPAGMRVDGLKLYRIADARWHKGRDEGLYPEEAFDVFRETGVMPKAVDMANVPVDPEAIIRELAIGPLGAGLLVTRGWFRAHANGGIDEGEPPEEAYVGAHYLVLPAAFFRGTRNWTWFKNSWGADHGWHGCDLLTLEYVARATQGPLYAYRASADVWREHRIPAEYLVRRAA